MKDNVQGSRLWRPESYQEGAEREWLVANGLGGYASTTAIGSNTRAYHGLLVAALDPPVNRWLLLSSLDEDIGGVELANHQYPGVIHPQGFRHLALFDRGPLPTFIYEHEGCRIEKTIFMIHSENTTVVRYRIRDCWGRMRVHPLVHSRSFHATCGLPQITQQPQARGTVLQSCCMLALLSDRAAYVPWETVYYNFEYEQERRRGLGWRENLLCPGFFELDLSGDTTFSIAASVDRREMPDASLELEREEARILALRSPLPGLGQAADSFLVKRGGGSSIIAGYPWFDDWGRDAMISLPGLLLTSGRYAEAGAVLSSFASAMKDGVIPNDLGARSYNTVDASLWFIQAAYSHFDRTGDLGLLRLLWPRLYEVVARYSRPGDGFGAGEDGLIYSGPALTWMDARVDGRPVTPRSGKCCEVNALWYSGLVKMESLAAILSEPWEVESARRTGESYQRFWNRSAGCLFDVLDPDDASIRPNQIIAAAIPGLLPLPMRKSILETVTRELLTPFGLRTLSPKDPSYIGRYEGSPAQRDRAYHQGTVWPWLLGPYVDALLSISESSDKSRAQAREVLWPLVKLNAGGIGTLSEVFDGDRPQNPGGCFSQAWSVAEVLRSAARAGLDLSGGADP